MSAQFKQNESSHHVIAVPRMLWLHDLIMSALGLLTHQAIVCDVIDGF